MAGRGNASDPMRAGRLVRPARFSLCAAALAAAALAFPTPGSQAAAAVQYSHVAGAESVADFYAARANQPLWLRDDGRAGDAARLLIDYLRTADADGLDPGRFPTAHLEDALRAAWGGSPARLHRADMMLSQAFVSYVRELKQLPTGGVIWVDPQLQPKTPSASQLLEAAAGAPSLERWMAEMGWMNPIYAGLRRAMVTGDTGGTDRQVLRLNLQRARALPSEGRYILVNATDARLTAYENGRAVDSMNVVVGKPKNPTPMMAAYIRFTSLNPYWYVPPDLAAERIAPNVLKGGLNYLKTHGYQVMSDWHNDAATIDPATIDWRAVADGSKQVWLRQKPGPGNSMGEMKFMFPNDQGIYLHDTPQKELLTEASRMFSGGCVRLEDAPRLARWLHGRPLQADSSGPEQRVDLPEPVPVFITYLTVMPTGTELATFPDVYGRDRAELAMRGAGLTAAAR
jgi:murein L,D-transpeptidase YcbB/YkuD